MTGRRSVGQEREVSVAVLREDRRNLVLPLRHGRIGV